jgi:hypothetical protein
MENNPPVEFVSQDKLLFIGNPHETVPRRLLLARDLSPRDKFTWQFLRLSLQGTDNGIFPSYDKLQCWLSDQPCHEKSSRSTVSHVLIMLRLTRWLSLCQRLRDAKSGQIVGNIYALYDNPPSPTDISRLDEGYLPLLVDCTQHRNRRIRFTATELLLTLNGELSVDSKRLCTGFPVKTEPGPDARLREKHLSPSSGRSDPTRRNKPQDSTSVLTDTDLKHKNRTAAVHWSVDNPFSPGERRVAERAMRDLDTQLCQQVVDDCTHRIAYGDIRRPLAYLLATLEKARRGEFNRLRRRHR